MRKGRRPELTGGGLIRSLGGWAASKKLRLKGKDRLKGDERILGDSDFVTSILAEANESLDRYYELKSQGYTIERVEKRVMEIFGVEKEVIYSKGRAPKDPGGSQKSAVLLGRARIGIYGHRISETAWDDATRSQLCCQPRRKNRQREKLQFNIIIYIFMDVPKARSAENRPKTHDYEEFFLSEGAR